MKAMHALITALTGGILLVATASAEPPGAAASPPGGPVVRTQTGDVQGISQGNVFAFKGIPYAAPPVGDTATLAFKSPGYRQRMEAIPVPSARIAFFSTSGHLTLTPRRGCPSWSGSTAVPTSSAPEA